MINDSTKKVIPTAAMIILSVLNDTLIFGSLILFVAMVSGVISISVKRLVNTDVSL